MPRPEPPRRSSVRVDPTDRRRRLHGPAHGAQTEVPPDLDHQRGDRRMQVHVLVRVGVIQSEARGCKRLELSPDLAAQLGPCLAPEPVVHPRTEQVGSQDVLRADEPGDLLRRQHGQRATRLRPTAGWRASRATGDVHRTPTRVHHADHVTAPLRAHEHPLREQIPRVKTTGRVEPNEPLLIDVLHIEPDLVHVAREHHFRRFARLPPRRLLLGRLASSCPWPAPADQIPHRIDARLVEQALDLFLDHGPNSFLSPRDARNLAEPLQESHIHVSSPRKLGICPSGPTRIR